MRHTVIIKDRNEKTRTISVSGPKDEVAAGKAALASFPEGSVVSVKLETVRAKKDAAIVPTSQQPSPIRSTSAT